VVISTHGDRPGEAHASHLALGHPVSNPWGLMRHLGRSLPTTRSGDVSGLESGVEQCAVLVEGDSDGGQIHRPGRIGQSPWGGPG
jgi:hypothetical protein